MRSRKKHQLTKAELRGAMSAGLTIVRYDAGGERATVRQLSPEGPERRQSFARRLIQDTKDTTANEEAT